MLKNENILCISSIDWDFIWQGHQEIMSILAANGNVVLYIENTGVRTPGPKDIQRIKQRLSNWLKSVGGIRKIGDNLYVFSPLVMPFPYSFVVRWINFLIIIFSLRKWMKAMNFSNPIVWTFLPTDLSRSIITWLIKKASIYYCIDSFSSSSAMAKKINRSESQMLKTVDLVFVTSQYLYDHCRKYSKKVYKFPFAVSYEKFETTRLRQTTIPQLLSGLDRPIVGYVGGIHKWIDLKLISEVAGKDPNVSFVFVGPKQTDVNILSALPNVHLLGKKPHDELPILIKYFDVCIIPYVITDYTKNVYPTKLNEYLALGKPVVATPIPELIEFNKQYGNVLYLTDNSDGFFHAIKEASYNNSLTPDMLIDIARQNSWQQRIEEMCNLIEEEIQQKKLQKEKDWDRNLNFIFRRGQKQILVFLIIILLYLMVFETPFMWLLTKPLHISQPPQKADVIIVFAGGVGESGEAGQGYKERTKTAVDLYNNHFADHIIFSSGYVDIIKEARLMRALSTELGVPKEKILIDEMAHNTYQNVLNTFMMAKEHGWEKILLVSSPYHMRRVQLIAQKYPGIHVIYTPVKNGSFYAHTWGITWKQCKGILQEYVAIAYYWWNGYFQEKN